MGAGFHSRDLKERKDKVERRREFGALAQYSPALKNKRRDEQWDGLLGIHAGKKGEATKGKKLTAKRLIKATHKL